MMKTFRYLSIILVLILGISSCELPDNVDPKAPADVPAETLFTNAQLAMVNQINETNVNRNITRLMVQYWQQTTYFDESRYLFQDRQIPDNYVTEFYRDVIMDFEEAKIKLDESFAGDPETKTNMLAIIEMQEIMCFQIIVDAFGNMPYTEAFQGQDNTTPVYDDAATIYLDLIDRLNAAIGALNVNFGSWGGNDMIYGGDPASWKKFGASLLMRIGMRLADYNASTAQSAVTAAMNAGVFTSNTDNATFHYPGTYPHVNAIYEHYVVDNRADYLPANTLIDMLLAKEDPRLENWFTQVDTSGNGDFVYLGAVAGLNGAQSYPNFSHFTDKFFAADFEALLMSYSEIEFFMAEAIERGFASGAAADHYANAITASFDYWGATGAADYITANPYDAGNYKMSIGEQKWIALYNRGIEAWAEWRRLDYPELNVPEEFTYGDIPRRMPYPYDENELNPDNYEAAVAAMGGDDTSIRLFWDTQEPPF